MNKVTKHFNLARAVAIKGSDIRQYRLGAVGQRADGAIVKANNLPDRNPEPHAHAEARVLKKLGRGGVVYVVRVSRDGKLTTARPCKSCRTLMKNSGVKRCYYSINETEYGVIRW